MLREVRGKQRVQGQHMPLVQEQQMPPMKGQQMPWFLLQL